MPTSTNQSSHKVLDDVNAANRSTAAGEKPAVTGWVNYASWLSGDLMLMAGWFPIPEGETPEMYLASEDKTIPLRARSMSFRRPDLSEGGSRLGKLVTVRLPKTEDEDGTLGTVMVRADEGAFAVLGPQDLGQALTDLQVLIRGGLAWWDQKTRTRVMQFLASAGIDHEGADDIRLSRSLYAARRVLRAPLAHAAISRTEPQGLHVDTFMAVDEKSFYVKGWMRDEEAEITRLTAVSPEGAETEILEGAFRYPRPDVEQFYSTSASLQPVDEVGFISYFETEIASRLPDGWVFEMRNASDTAVEVNAPSAVRDDLAVRESILRDLIHERPPEQDLTSRHAYPAVEALQERFKAAVEVRTVAHYGKTVPAPEVSVVIPLYRRIDLLEQQLAQFVHDPEIRETELIYVLDSPELARSLAAKASQLFDLYRVPFSVVTLKRNSGFSAVNNIGASRARGRLLLMLNSDVLPDKPGWIGEMKEFYDATPGIGALGPKLLYEDDSLQHAGIYFSPLAGIPVWENRHYFKGLHRSLPAANVARPVPAVTGACMMIAGDLYERCGGLRGMYVQGDYEDSDLCLRLAEGGYENWYLPQVELYHLEGQSYALSERQLNGHYNAWLHTHLWSERIEESTKRYALAASGARGFSGNGGKGG
jgi:GT2 family glycosyltransferase